MKINEEYHQIRLNPYNQDENELCNGKTIENIRFSTDGSHTTNFLIITFTDKTYIAIGIDYDEDECQNYDPYLKNYFLQPTYNSNIIKDIVEKYSYIKDGKLCFVRWVEYLRELNLLNINKREIQNIINQKRNKEESILYEQYLKLKEHFEPNVNSFFFSNN